MCPDLNRQNDTVRQRWESTRQSHKTTLRNELRTYLNGKHAIEIVGANHIEQKTRPHRQKK